LSATVCNPSAKHHEPPACGAVGTIIKVDAQQKDYSYVLVQEKLRGSGCIFTSYRVAMNDKIYTRLTERDFEALSKPVNTVKTKVDYEYIRYTFYDRHEFGCVICS